MSQTCLLSLIHSYMVSLPPNTGKTPTSVIYCCITNNSKIQWLKTTTILLLFLSLGVDWARMPGFLTLYDIIFGCIICGSDMGDSQDSLFTWLAFDPGQWLGVHLRLSIETSTCVLCMWFGLCITLWLSSRKCSKNEKSQREEIDAVNSLKEYVCDWGTVTAFCL